MIDNNVLTAEEPFDVYENILMHEGVLHKSGRYPWGSGKNPHQRNKQFVDHVESLKKQGLSEKEIAEGLGLRSSTELRSVKTTVINQIRAHDVSTAIKLKEKGLSNTAIGEKMGKNESSVRALLNPATAERQDILNQTANFLKSKVKPGEYLDVGKGVENHLGISDEKKNAALSLLKGEGYKIFHLKSEQLGTGKNTTVKILADKDAKFPDIVNNRDKINSVAGYSEDGGRTFKNVQPPVSVNPKRVAVRYGDEGGAQKDGVIELRRGVDDLSLGESRYAQVRIKVGDSHYLKGMAMYSDKMPDGVDMVFNTNKSNTGNKLDAMKELKKTKEGVEDPDLPFGSIVRQKTYTDKNGKTKQSPLNIVGTRKLDEEGNDISSSGEEGGWHEWSRTLSSQMLSKQSPSLAKQQLDLAYQSKKSELNDIMALTNPTVKKKLLEEYADGADSSSVHLKAAGLPRTRNHVILPINSLKDDEIYAPNYKDGESVVLIRHPHGGKFEIPELKVNNQNKEAKSVMKNALDAVGINSKVAERLSGADFDGDTVLVIPNNHKQIKTQPALKALENFDPKVQYKGYEGMPPMRGKQKQMGDVSNLITDMHIKGANINEIARAVKHSMVVIDAEKHNLNWKQSAIDNGIAELKGKYQGSPRGGASTLVSKAKSDDRTIEFRKPRSAKDGGPIDPITGKKMWEYTGEEYTISKVNKRTGEVVETTVRKKAPKIAKMLAVDDAHALSSGQPIEEVYANHANKLKALANTARKDALSQRGIPQSASAKKTYEHEVQSLNAKLNIALKNAPLERKAQLIAQSMVKAKVQSNPGIEKDEIKKISNLALVTARDRTGAQKQSIKFTDAEWKAVQAGAISASKLKSILDNADMDQVKQLSMPREKTVMSPGKIAMAETMLARGYTQEEVASALGVSASTIVSAIKG